MSALTWQGITMVIYLAGMLAIGYYAFKRTADTMGDYMLGGRSLSPAVTALSAGAADMSGWLLMGLPGAVFATGLIEAWIGVGLTIGAWLNWKFVAPRLRAYTEVAQNSITIPSFFDRRLRDDSRVLRIVAGLVILVFFTFYVYSGMVAGGVFMQSSFGTDYRVGLLIIAGVTVAYTLVGGFLAVSYTDFAQGLLLFVSLLAVPIVGLIVVGGPGAVLDGVRAVDAAEGINRLSLVQNATLIGVVSALAWGLGYFGQPHIIVRFMAIRSIKETVSGRRIGIGWMIFTLCGAIGTALVGVAYFHQHPELTITDPETVFIALGRILFHPVLAGFMLAAVLAAIMSTVSSQLLVSASALVEDIGSVFMRNPTQRYKVLLSRLAVLTVSLIAGVLAWEQDNSILNLVAFAWAGFGAAFGPTVLLSLWWRKLTAAGAIAGMITGAAVVGIWGNVSGGPGGLFDFYEIIPGFLANLLVAVVVSLAVYKPNAEIEGEFDEASRRVAQMHDNRSEVGPEAPVVA